ncbi:MAG: hypothetical protein ACPLZH_03005 [Minisyncoccales bacterium]
MENIERRFRERINHSQREARREESEAPESLEASPETRDEEKKEKEVTTQPEQELKEEEKEELIAQPEEEEPKEEAEVQFEKRVKVQPEERVQPKGKRAVLERAKKVFWSTLSVVFAPLELFINVVDKTLDVLIGIRKWYDKNLKEDLKGIWGKLKDVIDWPFKK